MADQGPFSDVLSGPLIGRTEPQVQPQSQQTRPSGFMPKAGGIAMFADKFLEGISKGRLAAFQKSELTKAKEYSSLNDAIKSGDADVQAGRIDPDAWAKQKADLEKYKAGIVLGHIEDPDGSGGQGKTQTPPGGSKKKKDGKTDGQGNPVMGVIKSVFEKMAGPGAEPIPYTPGEIYAQTGKAYTFLADQKNSLQARVAKSDADLFEAHKALTEKLGHYPNEQEQMADEAYQKARSAAVNPLTGKPTDRSVLFDQHAAELTQQQTPEAKYKREESEARAKKETAEAGLAESRAKNVKEGKIVDYVNANNQIINRIGDEYFVPGDPQHPIPTGDSRLQGLKPWQKTQKPVFAPGVQANGTRLMWNQEKNDWEPLKDANGKVAKFDTPAGLQAMRESGMEARQFAGFLHGDKAATKRMTETYDRLIVSAENSANMDPKVRDAEVKKLKAEKAEIEAANQDIEDVKPPYNKTQPPPKPKGGSSTPPSSSKIDDKVMKLAKKHGLLPGSQSSTAPPPSQ